jgi:glycine hydroxymethyltransferase
MNDTSHLTHLLQSDPQTAALISAEQRRQREKIILIPSESLTPPEVREALGSVFTSVYAEGYPRPAMRKTSPDKLADLDMQLAAHRRYADWRFYKGTEMADLVESLAGRRAAECFATPQWPSERIYANVQPLSGAAANLAVYEAFVEPGDTVMGMDLTEGGHLTHGSQFNITGKRYNIVSYAANRKTGKLDYEKMMELALKNRPKMIIGGFTSFPWQPDWHAYREIADAVGAILLADVAHTAGMIVGGVYPNPIGIADVVSFTTHKTLCGPRGAVILSTDPQIAARIDTAIFPGEQGGPHVNKFAAIAVALKLAQRDEFVDLQRRIVENAKYLADALVNEGLTLAYGGTNTHLLLVDLRRIETDTGFTMMGEIASRVLDLVGIVCNKNTIPGDHSAADAHGIRLGTPWATQRGMGKVEMEILASIIAKVLRSIRPFSYRGLTGDLSRGKLPLDILREAKEEVRALISRVDPDVAAPMPQEESGPWTIIRVRGGRSRALLHEATTSDILSLSQGEKCETLLFDKDGVLISEVVIGRIGDEDYLVLAPREGGAAVQRWLSGLADGYTLFDNDDLFRKVEGPALIEKIVEEDVPEQWRNWLSARVQETGSGSSITTLYAQQPKLFSPLKPYFVAQKLLDLPSNGLNKVAFTWQDEEGEMKRTPLYDAHKALGARLVPFAGWEMPVWYTSAMEEHRAIRNSAGLFDLGHMGVFHVSGEHATEFLNNVTANYAAWLEDGESQYAYLFDPEGNVIDDIFVYRRSVDRYLVVVNASNENKDWEWLTGVNDGRYLIDADMPTRDIGLRVTLRDLKRERDVMDIALQGPRSEEILGKLLGERERNSVAVLKRTEFCEIIVDDRQMIVARTGYTGEEVGYEIYLAAPDAVWLWDKLLEVGRPLGLLPCGLASRDSTRTEAGFPLYGHELAGGHNVNPFEAGFGAYVKLHKPFFIGRERCVTMYTKQSREIVRFEVTQFGSRPVRGGAAVIDKNGSYLGRVTSCVSLGETQVGLALLDKRGLHAGTSIALLNPPRVDTGKPVSDLQVGDRIAVAVDATVVTRFPEKALLPQPGGE